MNTVPLTGFEGLDVVMRCGGLPGHTTRASDSSGSTSVMAL
jgi:hypothetical protein